MKTNSKSTYKWQPVENEIEKNRRDKDEVENDEEKKNKNKKKKRIFWCCPGRRPKRSICLYLYMLRVVVVVFWL